MKRGTLPLPLDHEANLNWLERRARGRVSRVIGQQTRRAHEHIRRIAEEARTAIARR
jgi:hypothetical protein